MLTELITIGLEIIVMLHFKAVIQELWNLSFCFTTSLYMKILTYTVRMLNLE